MRIDQDAMVDIVIKRERPVRHVMVVIATKMILKTRHVMVGSVPSDTLRTHNALKGVKKMHAQIKNVRHVIRAAL